MGQMLAAAVDLDHLHRVLDEMLGGDRQDGAPSDGLARLSDDADARLAKLATEVLEGTFEPVALTEIVIPKPNGGERRLGLP